uniref:Uncharacterized protein n=1 Tax=Bionectria ochroleuca TaxID=29856 RepID=A0A0B7KDR4_BIOOC
MLLNLLDGIIRLRFPRTDLVLVPNQAVIEFATNLVSRTKFDYVWRSALEIYRCLTVDKDANDYTFPKASST